MVNILKHIDTNNNYVRGGEIEEIKQRDTGRERGVDDVRERRRESREG